MSYNPIMIPWVDALLRDWARWTRGGYPNLGYPRTSIMYRIHHDGPVGASIRASKRNIDMPSDIHRAEQAILTLPKRLRNICKLKYLKTGWTNAMRAKRLGVSTHQYRVEVDHLHWAMEGRLAARCGRL